MTSINGIASISKNDPIIKTDESIKVDLTEKQLWQDETSDADMEDIDLNELSAQLNPQEKKSLWQSFKSGFKKFTLKTGSLTRFVGLPVGGKLLNLSFMSDEERIKAMTKDGGKVLTGEENKKFLESIGLIENEREHTESDKMGFQTLLFSEKSKITKEVQSNKKIQEKMLEWLKDENTDKNVVGFNTANAKSFDLRLGLGYVLIAGLEKTEDGYIKGYVEDVYDYDPSYNKGEDEESGVLKRIKSKGVQTLNDMAVDLQNDGKLHNYRVLVPVKVKIPDELLKA